MSRALIICISLCLLSVVASAADANVDSAIMVLKQTDADASKLKTYCEFTKTMETAGDKEDAATDAKIDRYLKQLGPDFETAWNTGESVDESSVDGKAFGAVLDELARAQKSERPARLLCMAEAPIPGWGRPVHTLTGVREAPAHRGQAKLVGSQCVENEGRGLISAEET
jgi:hypothetical protein